jgi:hypothetical protein
MNRVLPSLGPRGGGIVRTAAIIAILFAAIVRAGQPDAPRASAAQAQLAWFISVAADPGAALEESRFAPGFLAQVPTEMLARLLADLRPSWSGAEGLETALVEDHGEHLDAFVRGAPSGGAMRVRIAVDAEGRIAGLLLTPAAIGGRARCATFEDLDARLEALPGRAAIAILEFVPEGDPIALATRRADERMAIGSTFKLYVLIALSELVEGGEAAWDERLAVRDGLKSLPSGTMQVLREGTERPLEEFARAMISISDNTATDHLIARVGRERVESVVERLSRGPRTGEPLLTTMEMFRLKLGGDADLLGRFASAGDDERRRMLEPGRDVSRLTPNLLAAAVWSVPTEIERVEWFASAVECCLAMAELDAIHRRDPGAPVSSILSLNPGLAFPAQTWPRVWFKGGSEPGVLNLTWLLTRTDGRTFGISMTWNDPRRALDEQGLLDLAGSAVELLAAQP